MNSNFVVDERGRRVALSMRQQDILRLEEYAHSRADALKRTFYVIDDNGVIRITDDPMKIQAETVLRICRPNM